MPDSWSRYDQPRKMADEELASPLGIRQWLLDCRLYELQILLKSIRFALWIVCLLIVIVLLHTLHLEWAIWARL
jgi:hypothetical protein